MMNLQAFIAALGRAREDPKQDAAVRATLAAISDTGLSAEQTGELTVALARSGKCIDWSGVPALAGRVPIDLPSTGGVSNKTPILAPLLALASAPRRIFVPKVSSRGRVAGTIDILEAVGYRAELSPADYMAVVTRAGISNVVQSDDFVPADRRLMAIRRRVGAMNVGALVVSSILAKKIASGCRNIVVDVKAGEDSKFGDLAGVLEATRLFRAVGELLRDEGLIDTLWIAVTNSYRCQGRALGRRVALWEVARVLRGEEGGFLCELATELAGRMLLLAGAADSLADAVGRCRDALGEPALEVASRWLAAHGARTEFLDEPDILLRDVRRTRLPIAEEGRLLRFDAERLVPTLIRMASDVGCHDTAGLLFEIDPATGANLDGSVFMTATGGWDRAMVPDVTSDINRATVVYKGDGPLRERPTIVLDSAMTLDGNYEHSAWERTSRAAYAVIRHPENPEILLLGFNRKWKQWNFLGGHYEPDRDADDRVTVERELVEELGEEIGEKSLVPASDFKSVMLGTYSDVWWSKPYRAWTLYKFTLFTVIFHDQQALLALVARHGDELCWARISELRTGRLATGESLSPFPATVLASRGLLDPEDGGRQ